MSSSSKIMIALILAILSLGVVMYIFADDLLTNPYERTYQITYEPNGGELSGNIPETYTPGDKLYLPSAYKEGELLAGWYLDKDLTIEFDGKTAGMYGDIKLYAAWVINLSGHTITFSKSGYYERGFNSYTLSGYLTCTYLYYSEAKKSYYIQNDDITTYTYTNIGGESYTETGSTAYWGAETDRTVKYGGTETIKTSQGLVECDVYIFTYPNGGVEKHWDSVDSWITYKMEYTYTYGTILKSEYKVTYTYISDGMTDQEIECELDIYEGYNVTVSGASSSTYSPGQQISLTASTADGTAFGGWYDESLNLISKNETYTFIIGGPTVLYASNTNRYDLTVASDEDIDLDSLTGLKYGSYDIVQVDTGAEDTSIRGLYTFSDGGSYRIEAESEGKLCFFNLKVTGDVDRTFTWKYSGHEYTVTLGIDYDDYLYAVGYYTPDERWTDSRNNYSHDKSFVILSYTDERMAPYMEELVDKLIAELNKQYRSISETTLLNYLLAFTQYIEYQSDEEYMDLEEYWKFPLETLFDQGGDCEDTSILFCALAHQSREKLGMDYKTAIVLLPSHMAGAVKLSGDRAWSYCETTSTRYRVGDVPSDMKYYFPNGWDCEILEIA